MCLVPFRSSRKARASHGGESEDKQQIHGKEWCHGAYLTLLDVRLDLYKMVYSVIAMLRFYAMGRYWQTVSPLCKCSYRSHGVTVAPHRQVEKHCNDTIINCGASSALLYIHQSQYIQFSLDYALKFRPINSGRFSKPVETFDVGANMLLDPNFRL